MLDKNIQQTLQAIKQQCQQQGLSFTTKRSNVMQLLLEADKAMSAYDIADAYQHHYRQKISPVSVYRMLDFLIKIQSAHKLLSSNKYMACSHISCQHVHEAPLLLICNACSQVNELGVGKSLSSRLKEIIVSTDFKLEDLQLELHGLCADCQNV